MDTTASEITFYEDNSCSFCKNYFKVTANDLRQDALGQKNLDLLIENIKLKGKDRDYDCLIGISGGVDSSYVAYLVKQYGLRPLAIHLDNGWNTELAVSNVEQIVKRLNIDLITHVLDWREFKDIQISFLKSGISNIEIPTDHAIWAVLIQTANKMQIPNIIAGNNIVTESIMPESWLYGSKDSLLIRSIHKKFGMMKMKSYPYLTTIDYINYLLIKGIRWMPILNYIPYNKAAAKKVLEDELGWRDYGGKHYESIFTRFFHAYYLPKKFGYDLRKSYFSALICSGQMNREEALEELKRQPAESDILRNDKDYIIKKLNLTNNEFQQIMNAPPKTYKDYSNTHDLWNRLDWFVKKARRRITRIE